MTDIMHIADDTLAPAAPAELQIARLHDLYAALRQTTQAILHIQGEQALFEEICRIAVEHGRFQMAMIRLIDHERDELVPVAAFGATQPGAPIDRIALDADKARSPTDPSSRDT